MSAPSRTRPATGRRLDELTAEQLTLVLESIGGLAVFTTDRSGFVRSWSAGAEAMFGYAEETIVGRHVACFHPTYEIAAGVAADVLAAAERDGRVEGHATRVRADGSLFPAVVTVVALRDARGEVTGFVKAIRDMTDAEATAAPPNPVESLVSRLHQHAVATLGPDLSILSWNVGAEQLFGISAEQAIGTSVTRIVPAEDTAAAVSAEHIQRAFDHGVDEVECRLVREDGSVFWASCLLHALDGRDGPVGLGMIVTDRSAALGDQEELGRRLTLQARFERLADAAPGVILSFEQRADGTLRVPYASAAMEDIYGILPADVAEDATPVLDRVHPDDLPRLVEAIEQSAERLEVFRHDWRYEHPTKGEIWIAVASVPEPQPGGGVVWYGFADDVTRRKRMELELARHRAQLEVAQRIGRIGSFEYDPVIGLVEWSEEHLRIFGLEPGTPLPVELEDFLQLVHPLDRDRVRDTVRKGRDTGEWYEVEYRLLKPDGSTAWIHATGVFELDASGRPIRQSGTVQDITARRGLEEQLRQSQKMEAIGRLAGGVAHDFNNLLTVITGHSELLLATMPAEGAARASLQSIRQAAEHAAGLTRRLLAFSRKQVLDVRTIDLDEVVVDLQGMLDRMVGDDVVLELRPGGAGQVRADVSQIEQVVMNLVVNARDAMPRGGRITIATRAVELPASVKGVDEEIPAGRYVELTVEDTGTGMSPEVVERAFEPFFTTKETGKGTGLGLSMVFGIVRQSGGWIAVDSFPGVGTCMRILLPPAEERAGDDGPGAGPAHERQGGTATILLVEDDPGVRDLAAAALQSLGHTVYQAGDGRHALAVASTVEGPIDLLLTDVVMPLMGGVELASELRALRPATRVLLVSGYASGIDRVDIDRVGHGFLAKPFTTEQLAAAVGEALAARV